MADNISVTPGTGATVAADNIGGVLHQRVKLSLGADGTANDAAAGAGVVGVDTQRVTLATDVALPAGTNLLGKVGIDQTTPGTTNLVATNADAAIGAGTAPAKSHIAGGVYNSSAPTLTTGQTAALQLDADGSLYGNVRDWTVSSATVLGKVGIDQTTDGTTNLVAAKQSGTWNVTNVSGTVSLPTGAATAAKQPALGTAGTASSDVITVQGIASAVAIPVTYATATRTSRSGTITAGGTAQQLMAANTSRKGWCLQNNNTTGKIWFDETGATAVASQPSIVLYPGDFYESPPGGATPTAISIIGDTTGMIFSAREW
jgi:hypothetical protein